MLRLNHSPQIQHMLNEDLIIYHGPFRLTLENENCELKGVIWQDFRDKIIRFEGAIDKRNYNNVIQSFYDLFENPDYKVEIPHFKPINVRISTLDLTKSNVINISGICIDISLDMKAKKQINKVIIDVCNYVQKLNINQFYINDWNIDVIKRDDEKSTFEKLTNFNDTIITHRFIVSKKDNENFYTNDKELELLLETVDIVCSLTAARYVKYSNVLGCMNEKVVWEKYRRPIGSSVKRTFNWFAPQLNGVVEELFYNVLEKVKQEKWSETIKVWLSWYIESMNKNLLVESKIVATQVALESIGWTHLIEENDLIEENSFDKLNASDKLRLLLHEFKISKNLVENSRTEFIRKSNWIKDGPHLITEVRNNIVHPSLKKKKQQKFEILDDKKTKAITWIYGIYYLELSILYILGYKGMYQNRLAEWTDYEKVPWNI